MATPTLRTLARELGVSRTTISEALRDSPRVRPETAAKIRAAAEAAGYLRNPLAGAMMSELRRSRGGLFRGVLAVLDLEEPDRPAYAKNFHDALARGVQERATELGFRSDRFIVGGRTLPAKRLDQILQSRGIRGVILLPAWRTPSLGPFNWERYAGVYLDYQIDRPALHCVCSDHFQSMMDTLHELQLRGYKRPGIVLLPQHDARLSHRWESAFLGFHERYMPGSTVPPLVTAPLDQKVFLRWYRQHKPDIVLTHILDVKKWMRAAGAEIPRTHGFFCLNLIHATEEPCCGLDLAPAAIGALGVEVLIGQLQRNALGAPLRRTLTTVASTWVEGPTVQPRKRS